MRSEMVVTVTISHGSGRDSEDREQRVTSLRELYEICRKAAPAELVRVSLLGREGEVRLHFASLIRRT
jgi:hypothetical protein